MEDFKDIICSQKECKVIEDWSGTLLEYLYKVQENPDITNFAPGRMYNVVTAAGTKEVDETLKLRGYDDLVKYEFFKDKIYGTLESLHDIIRFLKAAARRTETGKRILILVGPVASGKSTIAALLKRGLENDETPKHAIKGCPIHEEPLHAIPLSDREYWEDKLGVRIEGDVCPVCQHTIDTEYTTVGVVNWEEIPVELIKFSEQRRVGIGTFQPSDPKSQDVTELIGKVNMSQVARYGDTDPRAFQFDGELQVANGGMIEMVELLKTDIKLQYVLISLAQEQVIKSPGFPQIYIDTLILAHTNQTEFDAFRADKKNEALHDRMYPIFVPWNLRVDDEIKIYEKMIRESDFRDIHIAPHTLKVAAQFAVLSRLIDSTKVTNKIEKMKLYNGEITKDFKKSDIDIKAVLQEGKDKGEGMAGISPRFIINALNVALGSKEEKKCVNSIDIIRYLRDNFNHYIGIAEEDKERFLNLLIGDKDSVSYDYKDVAKKEVNMAFIYAYEDQAGTLFDNYMRNITAFCKNEKVLDSITGEYSDPDEKLMRSIEELIPVPETSKSEFRNGIFVYKTDALEQKAKFVYKNYPPLKNAIEKKLMSDLKPVVSLSLADTTTGVTDPKSKKRREKACKNLLEKGYCPECANVLLAFIGEVLRKEE
ncbi:MAG: protein prkA [Candidatus Hodarchaeales archaeon]|jgi:serine protein kinase